MIRGHTRRVLIFMLVSAIIVPLVFYSEGPTEEQKAMDALQQAVNPSEKTQQPDIQSGKNNASTFTKIEYNHGDRRDPFLSILALTRQKIEKRRKKSLNPLENFDITEFKLLGVVFDGNDYYASLLIPDGKAFTIKTGITLGLYDGKVININEDSLTVREYVMNYKGDIIPKDTVLKLRKEEE